METIECFKCAQCNKLLPKDTSDYYVISGLKLVGHTKTKSWDESTYGSRMICEYTPSTERLFCSHTCITMYLSKLMGCE